MKIVAIGDLHGKSVWREALKQHPDADKVIFIGDYVDSRDDTPDERVYQNLMEIIQTKKRLPDTIVLLLGNHDLQYIYYPEYSCSGFRPEAQKKLTALFRRNKKLFQVAYQYQTYLFTHAGVSKSWYTDNLPVLAKVAKIRIENLAEVFNEVNESKYQEVLHTVGEIRGGFDGDSGGITWADIRETLQDPLPGFRQVVGHSRVDEITEADFGEFLPETYITYIDCLHRKTEFLVLEI
jgi:predicted phosphodiesterase